MDDRISSVKCKLHASSVDLLVKAFPSSVFVQSLFWHHRSLHCSSLNAADAVYLHFASKDHLPSILRQECLVCSRDAPERSKKPLRDQVYTVVLDTRLDYELNGVHFKDCTDVVHGLLTCPVLRTSTSGPIPLELVSDHCTLAACPACLSLDPFISRKKK
jgi:hypothetical protein